MPRSTNTLYSRLLLGLLLYLLASPIADQYLHSFAALAVDLTLLLPIVLGVWSMKHGTRWYWAGMVLTATVVLAQMTSVLFLDRALEPFVHLLACVFFSALAVTALDDVLLGGPVDSNRLTGAICVYMLLAIAWAMLYALLEAVTDQPMFSNLDAKQGGTDVAALVYFSLVTLTTLGYGDIAPLTPLSRMLASLEAAFGQLYLTVLVAALVGKLMTSWNPGASKAGKLRHDDVGAGDADSGDAGSGDAGSGDRGPGSG